MKQLLAIAAALALAATGCATWHTSDPQSFGGRKYSTETVPAYSGRIGPYTQELYSISEEVNSDE